MIFFEREGCLLWSIKIYSQKKLNIKSPDCTCLGLVDEMLTLLCLVSEIHYKQAMLKN